MTLPQLSLQLSLRTFLLAATVTAALVGLGVRWYVSPQRAFTYYANGQICREWWTRRNWSGENIPVYELCYTTYHSTGIRSCDGFAFEPELNQYYSPAGETISANEYMDYMMRDLGTGKFADAMPPTKGRHSPLAEEFDAPPNK